MAQYMAYLPLNPCLFFVGHGILPQVADVHPQAYRHVLKQVAASLVVVVRCILAHAPDDGTIGAKQAVECVVVVHTYPYITPSGGEI